MIGDKPLSPFKKSQRDVRPTPQAAHEFMVSRDGQPELPLGHAALTQKCINRSQGARPYVCRRVCVAHFHASKYGVLKPHRQGVLYPVQFLAR